MSEVNCFFKHKPAHNRLCTSASACECCVWNLSNGEMERRKRKIRNLGLTQRKDGLFGLMLR